MTQQRTANVEHHIVVNAPIERAFAVFTEQMRFTAESDERTRVDLEHRHLDRHGPGWQSVADAVDGDAGWPLYLGRYVGLFAAGVRR